MRVVAFGRTEWLYESIRCCAAAGHRIVLIGTCPAQPEYAVKEDDFVRLAGELGCPVFCDAAIHLPQYIDLIRESRGDVAISVNWLTLLRKQILDQFPYGVINAHAGDLPRFRGNACPNWAVLNGEKKLVLTLHRMDVALDSGPILLQRELDLTSLPYMKDIYRFMSDTIPEMFVEVLNGLASGKITPKEQPTDPALSLRCLPRLPSDGEVDWEQSAVGLGRLVRCSAEPFAGAYSFLDGQKVTIWRARPGRLPYGCLGIPGQIVEIRDPSGEVAVLTGDGVLVLEEVGTASGDRVRPSEFIRSTRSRFGRAAEQVLARLETRVSQLERSLQEVSLKEKKREREIELH